MRRLRSTALKAGAAAIVGLVASVSTAGMAWAVGTPAGGALIVDPTSGNNINTGGSHTSFRVKLPAGAACSGDTATNFFHVFGYILDKTAYPDPGLVNFDANGPVGDGTHAAYPLFDVNQSPYANAATAQTTGLVVNLPAFNFDLFSVDGRTTVNAPDGTLVLPTTNYNVGIACAKPDGTGDKFWNAELMFQTSATDPTGETWSTVPNPQIPEFPFAVVLPLSMVAIIGAGVLVVRRRQSRIGAAV